MENQTITTNELTSWTTTYSSDYVLSTEDNSIEFFEDVLDQRGYKNITNLNDANPFSSADIYAERADGEKFVFELKRRFITSTTYGDLICETDKYERMCKEYPNTHRILVNFFRDRWGCAVMSYSNREVEETYARKTTDFSDSRVVKKRFWCIKNNIYYKDYANYQ